MGWYVCPSLAIYRLFYHALTPYLLMTPLLPKIHTRVWNNSSIGHSAVTFISTMGYPNSVMIFYPINVTWRHKRFGLFLPKKWSAPFISLETNRLLHFSAKLARCLLVCEVRTCILLVDVFRIFWLRIAAYYVKSKCYMKGIRTWTKQNGLNSRIVGLVDNTITIQLEVREEKEDIFSSLLLLY